MTANVRQILIMRFRTPSIHGVICIRGGYGAQRLMDRIDWTAIAKTPKVFCGYSDVTILHLMLNQRCGFVTYHTPMPATEWYAGLDEYTERSLKNAIFGVQEPNILNPDGMPLYTIAKGVSHGVLTAATCRCSPPLWERLMKSRQRIKYCSLRISVKRRTVLTACCSC